MARLDFPSNPTLNQVHLDYIWNGYAWVGFTTDVSYDEGNFDALYVSDFVGIGTTVATAGDTLVVKGNAEFAGVAVTTGITTTNVLHVGLGGTTLTVDADNGTFAIGSATTTVNATLNGGTIPSIGMIIALGS